MARKAVGISLFALVVLALILYVLFRVLLWTTGFILAALVLCALFGWVLRWQFKRGGG